MDAVDSTLRNGVFILGSLLNARRRLGSGWTGNGFHLRPAGRRVAGL